MPNPALIPEPLPKPGPTPDFRAHLNSLQEVMEAGFDNLVARIAHSGDLVERASTSIESLTERVETLESKAAKPELISPKKGVMNDAALVKMWAKKRFLLLWVALAIIYVWGMVHFSIQALNYRSGAGKEKPAVSVSPTIVVAKPAANDPVPVVNFATNPIPNHQNSGPINLSGLKIPALGINCPSSVTATSAADEITLVIKK
ncbi:MAG: hypothetical protein AAB455_00715 [Patescibacteria group bacterium]